MNKFIPAMIFASMISATAAVAAPVTYDIATTKTYFGSISGSFTGEGSVLESYDITGVAGNATYSFSTLSDAQVNAGAFAAEFPYFGYQDARGNPINEFFVENGDPSLSSFATLTFYATGDFDTGLTYVGTAPTYNADGSPYLNGGQPGSATGPAAIQDASGNTVVLDDLTFTRQGSTAVPEPSSAAIMAVGLGFFGLALAVRRSRRG